MWICFFVWNLLNLKREKFPVMNNDVYMFASHLWCDFFLINLTRWHKLGNIHGTYIRWSFINRFPCVKWSLLYNLYKVFVGSEALSQMWRKNSEKTYFSSYGTGSELPSDISTMEIVMWLKYCIMCLVSIPSNIYVTHFVRRSGYKMFFRGFNKSFSSRLLSDMSYSFCSSSV